MNASLVVARRSGALTLLLLLALCSPGTLHAQGGKAAPAPALMVSSIAGQYLPVLPLTYVIVGEAVPDTTIPKAHAALVAWADSIVQEEILARGPEVNWISGAELRRKTRSAPGMVSSPDRLGQAALRFANIKRLPDPLFSNVRTIVALSNGRLVLVPAAVHFTAVGDSVRAETILVLADGRTGTIIWRSSPTATAATAAGALKATIDHIFPDSQ